MENRAEESAAKCFRKARRADRKWQRADLGLAVNARDAMPGGGTAERWVSSVLRASEPRREHLRRERRFDCPNFAHGVLDRKDEGRAMDLLPD